MRRLMLVFVIILNSNGLPGQVLPLLAPYTGFGAYSLHHTGVFSFTTNPSSLAEVRYAMAAVAGEKRFLLNALNQYDAAFVIATSSGNFGVEAGYYGFNDYNESRLGFAYAKKLGGNANAGIQFNYYNTAIAGYGNSGFLGFALGAVFHISDELHAGMKISNPAGAKSGSGSPVYSTGVGYEPSEQLLLCLEIVKEANQPATVNAGFRYQFLPQLQVSVGLSTATSSIWAGVGLCWKSYQLHIMTNYHQQLGITPGIMLQFDLKNEKK